jgi:hypothetical protein
MDCTRGPPYLPSQGHAPFVRLPRPRIGGPVVRAKWQRYTGTMNLFRATLVGVALALALPAASFAQWQWIDKDGRKVFSDQSPPADIPAKNILKQPGARGRSVTPAEPAAPAAVPAKATPASPKLSGKDKELEEKKKQAEAAEAEKKKEQDEQVAKERADNCARMKTAKTTLDSGARIARMNEKGEREYMDDAQRAAEGKRLETLIARDCKAPG